MNSAARTRTQLREFLDARFVRYTSLARELGVSPTYLHQLMEGRSPLTGALKGRLSDIFGVPIETFDAMEDTHAR